MHKISMFAAAFRRSPGQRPCPKQALACHWIEIDGRLECRWGELPSNRTQPAARSICPRARPFTLAALFWAGKPVFAVVMAITLLAESLTLFQLIGMGLIFIGG
jgi:hypothetical protein